MGNYANPEALVETSWVEDHLEDPSVVIVEVDVDTWSYAEAHVPGAIGWNWQTELCDTRRRDILSKEGFESLMRRSGISNDTTVVLYGDNNNWFAAWAFWQLEMFGHQNVRLMNGGRRKWLEEGRPMAFEVPEPEPTTYVARERNDALRTYLPEATRAAETGAASLIDVRSPAEYMGELLAPPGLPETCQRGGHIPGAVNVPWEEVCEADGTFKSRDALAALYERRGVDLSGPVIAYCRIGERSSHTWFVMRHLLGVDVAKNYDGSWTEWGNLVGAPIETGARG